MVPVLLALVVACGGSAGKVDQAVTIAKEIREKPDEAEKILGAHQMTADQWEALMYEIASDPAMAEQFEAGLQKK
ncbi:hypothetical protein [Nannocystis exedens]|nr:hypothetical protein [Nannocystis exedens]